jgi:hypothetical protein
MKFVVVNLFKGYLIAIKDKLSKGIHGDLHGARKATLG